MPRKKKPRGVPDLPPEQGFPWMARQHRRAATKAANHAKSGFVSEDQRRLQLELAAIEAQVAARHQAWLALPAAERRGQEYVVVTDESGQPVGIRPAADPSA